MAYTSKPKVSGLGILEAIDTVLERHRHNFTPKLSQDLSPKVSVILTSLGIETDPQKLDIISPEVAAETAREALENLGRAQSPDQIQQIITDSLAQSIITSPQLESAVNTPEEQIYQAAQAQVQDVVSNHQGALEDAAVLAKLSQAARLQKPDQATLSFASDQVEGTLEVTSPLMPPESRSEIKAAISSYLQTYPQKLADVLEESAPAISFDQIQKAQAAAHQQALAAVNIKPALATSFKDAAENVASHLGLMPLSEDKIQSLGLGNAQPKTLTFAQTGGTQDAGVGLALNSGHVQQEAFYSLLAYNREKLEKSLKELAAKVENLKKQKSLAYRDRKELYLARKKLQTLKKAQAFTQTQPKRFKTYLSYFQGWEPQYGLRWSSNRAWNTTNAFFNQHPGIFVPRTALGNQALLAASTFGGLSFGLGNFKLGNLGAVFKLRGAIGPLAAMGTTTGIMKRMAKATGAIFGGLALLFLSLGKAAFFGFLIGAAVGGLAGLIGGAIFGLGIASVFGPFAPAVAMVTVPLGALAGAFGLGSMGGIAGGLIALGLAAGITYMVSMGIGVAFGAGIGGFIGASIGGILGSLALSWLGPFGIGLGYALGSFVGTIIGSFIGAGIGAIVGFFAGRVVGWVISAAKSAVSWLTSGSIEGFLNAIGSAFGSFFGGIGSFLAGLGSTIWNGLGSGLASIANGVANFFGSLIGGGSASASSTATLAMVSVGGAVGTVAVGSLLVGVLTGSAVLLAAADDPRSIVRPGENQFVAINKKVSAPGLSLDPTTLIRFENDNLPQTLIYRLEIVPKANLTNITCQDKLQLTQKDSSIIDLEPPAISCPQELSQDEPWELPFEHRIPDEEKYLDSLLVNTFTLTASTSFAGGTNYFIPLRDDVYDQGTAESVRQFALDNYIEGAPDGENTGAGSLIEADCQGQPCWEYVINQSRKANVNPTFILAVWYEESHFSNVGKHFSCPASKSPPHTTQALMESLNCFLTNIVADRANTPDGFIDAIHQYCGTGPYTTDPQYKDLCSNDNLNFLPVLRQAYQKLGGEVYDLESSGDISVPFTISTTATAIIGEVPAGCPQGWPVIGSITQGPEGATSHADNVFGGYEAIDIGQGAIGGIGQPVYATLKAVVESVWQETQFGNFDRRIRVRPLNCPGLATVNFWHLSTVDVAITEGQILTYGQKIGESGDRTGPHVHYQFNEVGDRSFRMTPPYIPQSIPRSCDGSASCNLTITVTPATLPLNLNFQNP